MNMHTWIRCLALMLVACGSSACGLFDDSSPEDPSAHLPTMHCGGPGDCKVDNLVARILPCPSGTCDPGHPNGKGVYIATDNDYCLKDSNNISRFCPEAFINTPTGVVFQLRDDKTPLTIHEVPVTASLAVAPHPLSPVELLEIRGDQTELSITYRTPADGTVHTATGGELSAVILQFSVTRDVQQYGFELKVEPVDVKDPALPQWLQRYSVTYRPTDSQGEWRPHCLVEERHVQVSFLGGRRVDGLTADAQIAPEVTTISCETGAIDSCLAWDYTPWNTKTAEPETSDYLFRTCLQAKRAAYFVGRGDLTSYTKSGTLIHKRDQFGINTERIKRLEAIWSPLGAECLNVENRRREELYLPSEHTDAVPACTPVQWSQYGKLATGPAATAP